MKKAFYIFLTLTLVAGLSLSFLPQVASALGPTQTSGYEDPYASYMPPATSFVPVASSYMPASPSVTPAQSPAVSDEPESSPFVTPGQSPAVSDEPVASFVVPGTPSPSPAVSPSPSELPPAVSTPSPEVSSTPAAAPQWTQGSSSLLSVRIDKPLDLYSGSTVDGDPLTEDDAAITQGSTIITLQSSYLSKLSVGEHTMISSFTDGNTVSTTFEVLTATSPKTGDRNSLTLALTFAVSICAVLTLLFGMGALQHAKRSEK